MEFIPVDYDPFAQTPPPAAPIGEPVDYDPFSQGSSPEAAPSPTPPQKIPVLQGEPVDYDPFAQASQVKPLPVDQPPLGEPVDYDPFATAGLRNNAEQIAAAATNQGDAYQPDPPASVMEGFDPTKTKQGSVSPETSEFLQRELPETSVPKKQALPAIFQEALDRSAERWKDPMAATGEPVDPQALEQGASPPFWQRIKEATSAATRVSPDRQALAVGLSEQTGASPSAILKNWDVSRRQAGMTVDPSTGELVGGLMMAPVVAGMMTNPLTTAAALAAFEAADEGVSGLVSYINGKPYHIGDRQTLVDLLSPESGDLAKGVAGAVDFAIKGAVAGAGGGAGLRVGREAFRKTTAEQTPSAQEYMSPEDFGKLHDAGMDIPAFLGKIGLKPNEYEAALRNGVDVFVPSGTRVTTSDRPWVESLKGLFGIKPAWEQTTTWNQQNLGGIPAEAPRPGQESPQTASPEPNFSQAALTTEPPAEGQSSAIQKPSDQPPGSPFRLGSITGKYESDGDYGMVSTGDRWGDPGGVSYGKYQLATNTGTFDAFLKFAGESAPSDPAGRAAWWKDRSKDPAFNAKQDAFIQATHYEPVRRYLLDNYGVDANQVPMLAETLYATGNAHGPKGAEGILKRALEGQDVAAMAPADIVNAIYDERMMPGENGGLAYWKSSPAKVQWSVARRLAQERSDVLALSGDGTVSSMEAQGETTVAPQQHGVVRPRETFDLLRSTAPAGQAEQTGPPAEQPATPVETPPPVNADEQALSTFLGQEPASQVAPSISPQPSPGETPLPIREPAPVPPAPAKIETPAVDVSQPTLGTPPAATVMTTASPTPPTSVTPNLAPRIEELSALPSRKLMAMAKEHGVALRGPTKIQDLAQMIAEAEAAQQTAVVETAAHAAATSPLNELPQPTEPQKQAGNYQKGHVRIQGLDISIENPAGSVRSGTTPDGRAWQTPMQNHYGYIKGTKGKDKDHLDVFLGPSPEVSPRVFVVNQTDPNTGKFDEHKVMMGFDSPEQARAAYLSNYEPGWQGFGSMASMDMPGFKGWLKNGSQNRPAVDRKPLLQNKGTGDVTERPLDQPGMVPGQQGPGLQESISPATASTPDDGMPVSPVGQGEDSPASVPPMPKPTTESGPSAEELAQLPVRQLRTMAQEHGVKLAGPVKKTDLVQMIVEAQAQKTPPKTREDSSPLSNVRFQRTYQGSPTRGIERMDDAYLGTGEGGRRETENDYSGAYGWGHYSAQNRKVGEKYRELLQAGSGNKMRDTMARIEAAAHGDLKEAAAIAHDRANMSHLTQEGRKYFNQIAKLFEEGQSATGQLYQLEVPDSDKLLDWDKTLDEQPEGIKEKLEQLLSDSRDKIMSMPNRPVDLSTAAALARGDKMTGGDLYESMAIHLGSAKAASQYLNSIGIPGHQYLDASSRGEGEGTHNIVTYSDRHIDITDRFRRGEPSVGGTAAPGIREALRPALARYPAIAKSMDVYDSESDLPYRLRRKVERAGVSGRFHGMYDPLSGRIAIVSGNIPNTKVAQQGFVEALLHHEGRHKGLDRVFGSARMKQVWMTQAAETIKADVSAWLKGNNLEDTSENRAEAAEEILVDWAKRGKVHALVDKLLAKIAAWVRSIFPDLKLTKAELRQMLARVDDWLKGSNADGARFFGKEETAPAFARGEAGEASSYSVNDATMPRTAKTFAEARTAAKAFVGKELANDATGMVATVSNTTVSKMLSESAVRKSVSPEAQAYAVANLDKLFKNSEALKVHPDRDGNEAIKAIHRMYAPMLFQGDILITKMTVKELREQRDGNRIYSVETMEIEKAAGNWVASIPGRNQENSTPQAAFMEKIRALQAKVKGEAALAHGQNDETTFSRSGQSGPDVVIPAHAQRITPHSRSLDRIVGRDLRGEPFHAGTFKEVSIDALPDRGHGQVAQGVARRFGKLLRFYTAQGEALGIHGVYLPGKKTIFVDARSPLPHLFVLGHELTHHLAETAPDLYDRLVNLLAPHLDKTVYDTLYREQNDLFPPGRRAEARKNGLVQQEVIANVVGEQMTKKAFWEDMAAKEPTLFRRIADWLVRQLDRILQSFSDFERVSEKAFTDVVAVRKAVADVMTEFSRRTRGREESAPPRYQRSSSPGSGSEASSPAEGVTGRRNRRETAPEDLKQSHAVKLEMPELVTLAKGLLGQYPKVYARLFGRRVGSFHHGIGHTSEIKLRASNYIGIELGSAVVKDQAAADAFVDSILKSHKLKPEDVTVTTKAAPGKRISVSVYDTDQDYAAEVLAHEIGHLIDYLPDQTLARGNVLGHIASLKKYMGDFLANGPQGDPPLTPQDKLRLKKEATRLAQGKAYEIKIDEEIEKIVGGVTPDEILSIWRDATAKDKLPADLYNYVAGLSGVEKKSIMVQALKGLVPDQIKRFTKTVKVKTGRLVTQTVSAPVTEADITAEYERLLHAEIAKRRLFSAADLTTELKALTRWWDPFDPAANPKYTAYRHKNTELYADALSVLLNAPNELATRAPNFHEAFFNWMMSKPKVTKLWRDLQTAVVTGDVQKDRVSRIYDMFQRSDEAYRAKYDKPLKTMTPIKTAFIDRFAPIYEILTGPGPRFALEKAVYSGSQKEGYLRDMLYRVQTPLEKVGLTADNLGEYLFHLRVVGERDKMANPLGMTAKASQERLDEIESGRVFNSKQVEALKHAEQEFRKIRSKDITDFMRKSGMFSPDLMKRITANTVYSTFDVFIHSVEENYGRGVGALIHQQIGTHQEITNPYTATLMHDLAMIGSINWNTAKRAVIQDVIRGKRPGLIEPADQRFNGKVMAPVEPKDPAKGMIAYMDKGEVKAFYVDKMVADAFKSGSAEEINALGKILFYAANPFRLLFTQLRPGFQLFNIIRDARTLSLNLPGANNELRVAKEYAKAIVPAFQSAFGLPNEVVREMERQNMLLAVASPADLSREDRQSERLYQMYGLKPKLWKAHVFGPLNDAATWIALCALKAQNTAFSLGAALERIPKVAGYTYLKRYFPNMSDDEIGHRIRSHAGSPAFLMRSVAHSVTNNIFLFSNAFVQGWRASLEVMRESPQSYWWKWTKWSLLPKAAMLAAAAGLLGAGIRELMDGVSEYDKTNYTIIPLGKDSNGKTVYLRLPMDETSRFTGGLLWKTFGAAVDVARDRPVRLDRASQVLDFTAGQFPGLHPAITTLEGVANYAMGHNPYDPFRQRPVLDDTTFTAGGKYAAKDMAGWAWNNLGGGAVYTFKSGEDIPKLKSEFETIVGLPGLGDTLGRFLKVSNTGIHEQLRDAKVPVNQANARLLLDVRAVAAKALNKEPLTEGDQKAIKLGTKKFGNALMKGLLESRATPFIEEYMKANTAAEKRAIVKRWGEMQNK